MRINTLSIIFVFDVAKTRGTVHQYMEAEPRKMGFTIPTISIGAFLYIFLHLLIGGIFA